MLAVPDFAFAAVFLAVGFLAAVLAFAVFLAAVFFGLLSCFLACLAINTPFSAFAVFRSLWHS
jgi:hypothetical protein